MNTENEITFRKPVENTQVTQVEEKVEDKTPDRISDNTTDIPIALYEELKGIPYTAKYFGFDKLMNSDSSIVSDIRSIDRAYKAKVAFGELKDGSKTYESFIREAEKATDTKDASDEVKIRKIARWVEFMNKMDEIDRMKLWL